MRRRTWLAMLAAATATLAVPAAAGATGDDDLWVFINKRLAIDLGGLHSQQTDTIDLDDEAARLGLTRGTVYSLDLFHAERHTNQSNFRIDTNLYFVDCGIIVPDEPVR